MKKNLFILAAAGIALASCSSDDLISENAAAKGGQPQEIALFSLANSSTRTGSGAQSGSLDHSYDMYVVAYQTTPNAGDYFPETNFTYNSTPDKWTGVTPRYWPLQASTLNFLAVTSGPATSTRTWGTESANLANKVVVAMTDNSSAQNDLMWAVGQGNVTQPTPGGALNFPVVNMNFNHTLALIKFTEKVTATASGKIKLTSITLNDAKYAGTLTVTCSDYNTTPTVANTTPTWVPSGDDLDIVVPGWNGAETALANTESAAAVGNGLMIVPQTTAGFASFTIAYQIQNPATNAWQNYTYTYIPTTPTDRIVAQGYQYTYNITFNLNEIEINPTVATWTDGGSQSITIQ